jgi:hypothetical protein
MAKGTIRKFLAIVAVGGLIIAGCTEKEDSVSAKEPPSKPAPTVKAAKAKPNWEYGQDVDKMSGEVTKWAENVSVNKVSMAFPYNGGSEGSIIVFEKNATIYLSKGQVMCSNYSGCTIRVKFDNEAPEPYMAVGPNNGQSNYVYLGQEFNDTKGARQFIEKLKTASRVMVSVEMYQENNPVWEFNVSGFNPK